MKKAIEIKNLKRKLWTKQVLNWVNMNIEEWAIYWLLWPNGAWKTTILKVISWLINKDSGEYNFYGESFERKHLENIWVLIDHPILYENNSWYDNMKIFALLSNQKVDYKKFDEILDVMWLEKSSRKLQVKKYSLGMKQRLAIWVALVWNPKFLILDEPLNWIDIEWVREFREILKNLQNKWITIILSSHILSEIEKTCTHIWIFNKWEMKFEWTKENLMKLGENIEDTYINLINK